jgi:hypothetical protein
MPQLPAPAPWPASEASTRVTPSSTATTELATDSEIVCVDTHLGARIERLSQHPLGNHHPEWSGCAIGSTAHSCGIDIGRAPI